jgi:hypothetical protein
MSAASGECDRIVQVGNGLKKKKKKNNGYQMGMDRWRWRDEVIQYDITMAMGKDEG